MGGEHSDFTHLVFKSKNKSSSSYQDWRLVDAFDVGRFGFALRFVGFCGSFLSTYTLTRFVRIDSTFGLARLVRIDSMFGFACLSFLGDPLYYLRNSIIGSDQAI